MMQCVECKLVISDCNCRARCSSCFTDKDVNIHGGERICDDCSFDLRVLRTMREVKFLKNTKHFVESIVKLAPTIDGVIVVVCHTFNWCEALRNLIWRASDSLDAGAVSRIRFTVVDQALDYMMGLNIGAVFIDNSAYLRPSDALELEKRLKSYGVEVWRCQRAK